MISITAGGENRTYEIAVPASYTSSTPQALYFVYHGANGNHASMDSYGFHNSAIAIYPDGVMRGGGIGWNESATGPDVAMFDAMLAKTLSEYCIDTSRVYTAGFSWGGWIASALGCVRGNVVKGFASVEGGFANRAAECKGPTAAWVHHDRGDPAEPFASGQALVNAFISVNTATTPVSYDAPHPCVRYAGKAPLVFCTPSDGWHTWPSWATSSIQAFFNSAHP